MDGWLLLWVMMLFFLKKERKKEREWNRLIDNIMIMTCQKLKGESKQASKEER